MRLITLLILITLSACAPMPGHVLFPDMGAPTPLDEIEEYVIITNPVEVSVQCNRLVWKDNPHQVVLNCLLNACIVTGCSTVERDAYGHVRKCTVYAPFGVKSVIDHENEHCMGYTDVWY